MLRAGSAVRFSRRPPARRCRWQAQGSADPADAAPTAAPAPRKPPARSGAVCFNQMNPELRPGPGRFPQRAPQVKCFSQSRRVSPQNSPAPGIGIRTSARHHGHPRRADGAQSCPWPSHPIPSRPAGVLGAGGTWGQARGQRGDGEVPSSAERGPQGTGMAGNVVSAPTTGKPALLSTDVLLLQQHESTSAGCYQMLGGVRQGRKQGGIERGIRCVSVRAPAPEQPLAVHRPRSEGSSGPALPGWPRLPRSPPPPPGTRRPHGASPPG